MLVLKNTTDAIELQLAGVVATTQPSFYASFRDMADDDSTFLADYNAGATNGTTAVDAVGGPAADTRRVIDHMNILNRDTANVTVTVKLDVNGTEYILKTITLAPLESLEYDDGYGWRVLTNSGSYKQTTVSGTNPITSDVQQQVLGADVTNNNATPNTIADVTGLSFAVTAGQRYRFRFVIYYTAQAGTTGSRWSVNGPASPTRLGYRSSYSLTATTETVNSGLSAYDLPAACNATSPLTTTGANMAIIEGFIIPSADGTVIARFASEIASSAIVALRGSYVEYQAVS